MLRQIIQFTVYSLQFTAKDILLCLVSASLLILSFPNFNLWLFAWLGFVPLFFALENKSKGKAFFLSYFTGIIFWLGIIYWLIHVTLPGTILLIFYLALYFGLFGLLIKNYQLPITNYQLLFIPSLWVLLEYLRSHLFTGFPWALLGYAQYLNLPIIQIADITGTWGVSFLVMMANVGIYSIMRYVSCVMREKQKNLSFSLCYLLPLFLLFLSLSYGFYKLHTPHTTHHTPLKISVIQGNIPQELKWAPQAKDFIIDKYLKISALSAKDKPDLIIWPEASLPVVLEEEPEYYERVTNFVKGINIPLLLGAVTAQNNFYPVPTRRGGVYYNSALLLSGQGRLQKKYAKLHLVPFGEYIPLRKIFGFLETVVPIGDFTAGKEYTTFSLSRLVKRTNEPTRFAVLICFEDLFPELSRQFVKKGANFLVNITNDAWYKRTSAPYQHLQASVFRAIENRICLVRSANTGVSGFIAPDGKIISLVQDKNKRDIFIDGFKTQEITISKKDLSFYTRYGDVFLIACFLFILYGIILFFRKK